MSIFIGKDNLNNPLLHITKTSKSASAMKTGVVSDTVFHSDLGYIEYENYACTIVDSGVSYASIPTEALNLIVSNKRMYFFVYQLSSGVYTQYLSVIANTPGNAYFYNSALSAYGYYPSSTYYRLRLPVSGVLSCYICIVNIDDNGFIPRTLPQNDIRIGAGDFIVKGVDLLDYKYIQSSTINDQDIAFQVNSNETFQLINSVPSVETIEIKGSPIKQEILKGNKVIFTTENKRNKIFYKEKLTKVVPYGTLSTSYSTTWDYELLPAGTFANGDMFFIKYFADGNTGKDFETSSNMLLSYQVGEMQQFTYNTSPYYNVKGFYVGDLDGSLTIRDKVTIYVGGSGTLFSKRYDYDIHLLK